MTVTVSVTVTVTLTVTGTVTATVIVTVTVAVTVVGPLGASGTFWGRGLETLSRRRVQNRPEIMLF